MCFGFECQFYEANWKPQAIDQKIDQWQSRGQQIEIRAIFTSFAVGTEAFCIGETFLLGALKINWLQRTLECRQSSIIVAESASLWFAVLSPFTTLFTILAFFMSLNSLHKLSSARENNGSFWKIEWCVVQALCILSILHRIRLSFGFWFWMRCDTPNTTKNTFKSNRYSLLTTSTRTHKTSFWMVF